jgi:hypothetical protein
VLDRETVSVLKDTEAFELPDEIKVLSLNATRDSSPLELSQFITENDLVPNAVIALRNLLCLITADESVNHDFSELKLMKTF